METLLILVGAVAVVAFAMFIANYEVEKKDFNKGVCPVCGEKLEIYGVTAHEHIYACPAYDHVHIAIVGNPYLNWKYGRKLKKKGL